jgi:hypothetical protein
MADRFARVPESVALALVAPRHQLELRVYLVHSLRCDYTTRVSRVSVSEVARQLGSSRCHVAQAEVRLEKLGALSRIWLEGGIREVRLTESLSTAPASSQGAPASSQEQAYPAPASSQGVHPPVVTPAPASSHPPAPASSQGVHPPVLTDQNSSQIHDQNSSQNVLQTRPPATRLSTEFQDNEATGTKQRATPGMVWSQRGWMTADYEATWAERDRLAGRKLTQSEHRTIDGYLRLRLAAESDPIRAADHRLFELHHPIPFDPEKT